MEHPRIRGLSDWKPLARGGLALVWEARQSLLARLVAVKVYQRELVEGDGGAFAREAGAAGKLGDHPGIVTAYDAGVLPDNRPYLIMELCPGGSVTRWLRPDHRPTEEQVRVMGIRVADALAAVHARGVVHRDVKPANILIDSFGHPRLADFGLAAVAGAEPVEADALRVTPAYAPPEAFGLDRPAEAGDVYSLAATLYALLAGTPPRHVDPALGLDRVLELATRPAPTLPGVNWFLMDALADALSNDPRARPTAAGFRDRLAAVPPPRTSKRQPRFAAAADTSAGSVPLGRVPAAQPVSSIVGNGAGGPRLRDQVEGAPDRVAVAKRSPVRRSRRAGVLVLAAAVLAMVVSGTAWLVTPSAPSAAPVAGSQHAGPGESSSSPATTPGAAEPDAQSSTGADTSLPDTGEPDAGEPAVESAIRLQRSTHSAEPFETVRLRGTYRGGADTFVRVQRWEEGAWVAFPIPAKTDESGRFTAYVELAQPRRYRLRVVDTRSEVQSEAVVVVIR